MGQARWTTILAALAAFGWAGCSSCTATDDVGAVCPPELPVERDGTCYAAIGDATVAGDDAAAPAGDAGAPDDAGGPDDDGGPRPGDDAGSEADSGSTDPDSGPGDAGPRDAGPTDAGGPLDAAACYGVHPIVMDGRRYCMPGWCYCRVGDTFDACYADSTARRCCPVDVLCFPP
jgi:hypothetical protein